MGTAIEPLILSGKSLQRLQAVLPPGSTAPLERQYAYFAAHLATQLVTCSSREQLRTRLRLMLGELAVWRLAMVEMLGQLVNDVANLEDLFSAARMGMQDLMLPAATLRWGPAAAAAFESAFAYEFRIAQRLFVDIETVLARLQAAGPEDRQRVELLSIKADCLLIVAAMAAEGEVECSQAAGRAICREARDLAKDHYALIHQLVGIAPLQWRAKPAKKPIRELNDAAA